MQLLVATDREVQAIDVERGTATPTRGIDDRPSCFAADILVDGRAWCGTLRAGVFRTEDGGTSWQPIGLAGRLIMTKSAIRDRENVERGNLKMAIHYLEIVSNDVDTLTALYQRMHGLSFGPPDPDLGQARVATRADETLVGIRKPLAAHEQPIMRTYLAVEDIQQAVKKAEDAGATIAYPPTRQGPRGTFAIVIHGDVQHGLWQR